MVKQHCSEKSLNATYQSCDAIEDISDISDIWSKVSFRAAGVDVIAVLTAATGPSLAVVGDFGLLS